MVYSLYRQIGIIARPETPEIAPIITQLVHFFHANQLKVFIATN